MLIRRFIAGAVVGAALLTSGTAIGHQTQGTDPGEPTVKCGKDSNITTIPAGSETFYVDARDVGGFAPAPVGYDGPYLWSVWVYREANNHAGMQTEANSASIIDAEDLENCTTGKSGHGSNWNGKPDELIY